MSRLLVGVAVALLVLAGPARIGADTNPKESKPPTEEQIAGLITKLGDVHFQNRQAAYQALVEIGRPALPQLRKAARSEDVEIQVRARKAIKEIEAQPAPKAPQQQQARAANFAQGSKAAEAGQKAMAAKDYPAAVKAFAEALANLDVTDRRALSLIQQAEQGLAEARDRIRQK
jgi:hypothetical protein